MITVAHIRLGMQQLLAEIEKARTPRVASLTAADAQDIRVELLTKVQKIIDELFEVRNAKQLAAEGQTHLYRALMNAIKAQNSILNDASLDEIQAMLEETDAELSQAQQPKENR